jgi:hypothetical protein
VHVQDLVALAVAVEALERLGRLAYRHLDVVVEHEEPPTRNRVTAGVDDVRVREPVHMRARHPLLPLDGPELADLVKPAGRVEVEQDRLVAREPLVAEHLLHQKRRGGPVATDLDVALGRDLSERYVTHG